MGRGRVRRVVAAAAVVGMMLVASQPSATTATAPLVNRLLSVSDSGRFVTAEVAPGWTWARLDLLTGAVVPMPRPFEVSSDHRWAIVYGTDSIGRDPQWYDIDNGTRTPIQVPLPGPFAYLQVRGITADGQTGLFGVDGATPTSPRTYVASRDGSFSASPFLDAAPVDMSADGRWVLLSRRCVPDVGSACQRYYRWDRATGAASSISASPTRFVFEIGDLGEVLLVDYLNGDLFSGGVAVPVLQDLDGSEYLIGAPGERWTTVSEDASTVVFVDRGLVFIDDLLSGDSYLLEGVVTGLSEPVASSTGTAVAVVDAVSSATAADIVSVRIPGRPESPSLRAGEEFQIQVVGGGSGGVPVGATAAVLNLAVTNPSGAGFATVWPCDQQRPLAANVNFVAGQTVSNAVVATLSAAGSICVYSNVADDVVVDVQGYLTGSAYTGMRPTRVLDTRNGEIDSVPNRVPSEVFGVQVAGVAGVPSNATAVALNLAVTNPAAAGFVNAWPCDIPRPFTANANFVAGQTVSNAVIAMVSRTASGAWPAGSICFASNTGVDVVVDVQGSFTGPAYVPVPPSRALDTRSGGPISPGVIVTIPVGGDGVPVDKVAAVLNVAIVSPSGPGFATVWPCNQPRPNTANVNFGAGETVSNAVIASTSGNVCVFVSATAHIVADLQGVFVGSAYTGLVPQRIMDTRF
jgi:hypothetical protein